MHKLQTEKKCHKKLKWQKTHELLRNNSRKCVCVSHFNHVRLFAIPWTVACHVPLAHEDSPGKNIGVGCHALLQGIFLTQKSNLSLPRSRQILYLVSHQGSPNTNWILLDTFSLSCHFPVYLSYNLSEVGSALLLHLHILYIVDVHIRLGTNKYSGFNVTSALSHERALS